MAYSIEEIKIALDNLRLVYGGCQSGEETRECNRKIKHLEKELKRLIKEQKERR